MKVPKEGEQVYVLPYSVPGHEDPGYSGRVVGVSKVNDNRFMVHLADCTGKVRHRSAWLHHISGYN